MKSKADFTTKVTSFEIPASLMRDLFAAAALMGMISSVFLKKKGIDAVPEELDPWDCSNEDDAEIFADAAYCMADAMLVARGKP